jgi:hypothetical protein
MNTLELLELAIAELGPAACDFTLVGGCLVPLLITDPAAPPPRATIDVDFVVEVISAHDYDQLSARVRGLGFLQGSDSGDPICRFRKGKLVVDLLPARETVLGFGNPWYPLAAATAARCRLPNGSQIRHATAPCFLATKLAAFRSRGGGDYQASRDFEDIVAVVDGRTELRAELASAPRELRVWVASELAPMLTSRSFIGSLPGMVPGFDSAARTRIVLARFQALLTEPS